MKEHYFAYFVFLAENIYYKEIQSFMSLNNFEYFENSKKPDLSESVVKGIMNKNQLLIWTDDTTVNDLYNIFYVAYLLNKEFNRNIIPVKGILFKRELDIPIKDELHDINLKEVEDFPELNNFTEIKSHVEDLQYLGTCLHDDLIKEIKSKINDRLLDSYCISNFSNEYVFRLIDLNEGDICAPVEKSIRELFKQIVGLDVLLENTFKDFSKYIFK